MKQLTDQVLIAFGLGELPLSTRLTTRVRLKFSARLRGRLAELQLASGAIASAYSPGGRIAFQANLALKLKRLATIDLCIGLCAVALGTGGGVYAWTQLAPAKTVADPFCATPAQTPTVASGDRGTGNQSAQPAPAQRGSGLVPELNPKYKSSDGR